MRIAPETKNLRFSNDITAHWPIVRLPTLIDFALTKWQIGALDWVKGATNDNSSYGVEQS
jgi:hypothetical protein